MHRAAELLKVAEKHLREARPDIVRISPAGDFRRGCELVGDLSLVAEVSRKNPLHVYAEVDAALGQGSGRSWSLIWGSALYAHPDLPPSQSSRFWRGCNSLTAPPG
jgi:hypothetical protein